MRHLLLIGLLMIGLAACESSYTNSDLRNKPFSDNNGHPRVAGR